MFSDNLFALNQLVIFSSSQFTQLTRGSISFPLKKRLVSSANIIVFAILETVTM